MSRLARLGLLLFAGGALASSLGCGGGGSFGFSSGADTLTTIFEPWSYQPAVSHATGAVSWALTAAPAGMTIDAGGLCEWTPVYADLGMHTVTVEATDDSGTVMQSFELRVNQGVSLGTTLSPRGHTSSSTTQDYIDHFSGHAPYGRVIAFHSSWRDDVASSGEIPILGQVATMAAADYGFTPAMGFGWSAGDGTPDLASVGDPLTNSFQNAETRQDFVDMVTDFALLHQPPYLFLGNETNTYFLRPETSAADWAAWISTFEECYDAIKAVSPATVVFTVFQLEHMKGLGANSGWSDPPQLDLIDDHTASGKIDAIGFTSYPFLEYDALADVPAGYYDEITTYWDGPVVFTELGWLAAPAGPYPGDETEQADFVPAFFALTDDLDLEYVTWIFLHDYDGQSAPEYASIRDIGLRSNDGATVRAAETAWLAEVALRE